MYFNRITGQMICTILMNCVLVYHGTYGKKRETL
nr:MAG TPA: hypothetical protein [Caudoviricetes sp.]